MAARKKHTPEQIVRKMAAADREPLPRHAYGLYRRQLEAELENLTPLTLPDSLVQVLARSIRSTLPRSQPPHGH